MRFSRLADWLAWQETLHPKAIDLGLARLRTTLDRLGWRPPSCPVVTVGGTNGKGSCVALLDRILTCGGYRVGTFTSPHLLRYNERITIAGCEVSDASLLAVFERIDAARGVETLTFFEFNALAALLVFETANLDAIVLEVGMGGRLDAANVVDADVALITSIALDHCEWLGADTETIGFEKAGILRAHRPAVLGSRAMPQSIARQAGALQSRVLQLGADFDFTRGADTWSWRTTDGGFELVDLPPPALFGPAQFDNASAVLQVLHCLDQRLPVSRHAVEAGLRTVRLAGRFQVIKEEVEWVLDVAHNPAAARTLAAQLALDTSERPLRRSCDRGTPAPAQRPLRRVIAVCGILGDKDVEGIVSELRDCFDGWIVAGLNGARALEPGALSERLRRAGADVWGAGASVEAACALARERAAVGDRIVVFGSFLTVAPALQWLQHRLA